MAIFALAAAHKIGWPFWLFGISALNLTIDTFIAVVIAQPHSAPGRWLNKHVVVALGLWSYGLYLWQQPLTFHRKAGLLTVFPFNIAVLLGIAIIGYYTVEKPAQGYARRLLMRRLQGRRANAFDTDKQPETVGDTPVSLDITDSITGI